MAQRILCWVHLVSYLTGSNAQGPEGKTNHLSVLPTLTCHEVPSGDSPCFTAQNVNGCGDIAQAVSCFNSSILTLQAGGRGVTYSCIGCSLNKGKGNK